jgi:hypothetical protein
MIARGKGSSTGMMAREPKEKFVEVDSERDDLFSDHWI